MKDKILASIDIGTNTFRLLIARAEHNPDNNSYSINGICSERIITRIGEGISRDGLLKKEAIDRSINALKEFSDIISRHNVYETSAVATSALRDAGNSSAFLKKAKKITGFDIEIITGEKEAEITASGMLTDMTLRETALLLDIGGGSTELIFMNKNVNYRLKQPEPLLARSLDLGVVYLANKYMKKDPPSNDDLYKMGEEISRKISPAVSSFRKLSNGNTVFIGAAGTVTALAAMAQHLTKYEHDKIHKFKLSIVSVRNISSTISVLTSQERARHIPFELSRLDIIVPGTLILLKLMEFFGFKEITVSNDGLREGILIELYKKISG